MKSELEQDILKTLFSEEEIRRRVTELGGALYDCFQGKRPLFLGILKGSCIFLADLVRACQLDAGIEFMAVGSYGSGTRSSGRINIIHDLQRDVTGQDLIIVEDILDSGNTLAFLKEYLKAKGAASVTVVTLVDKPARRKKAVEADFAGFVAPDEFLVGYGLDYDQKYRNLPYIGILKPEIYERETI